MGGSPMSLSFRAKTWAGRLCYEFAFREFVRADTISFMTNIAGQNP
jgi:hypothetical protein